MNSGMRPRIADEACSRRSCCSRQPDCQYGLGIFVVSSSLPPSISAYHSPHFPALQPGGVDGMLTTCEASDVGHARASAIVRSSGGTNVALGPVSVMYRRQSYISSSSSLP